MDFKTMRPGYKESIVQKAGIKITPIGLGKPGTVAKNFQIRVTKTNARGKEIEVKSPNRDMIYPEKRTAEKPGVYDKIAEITKYYFERLTNTKTKLP